MSKKAELTKVRVSDIKGALCARNSCLRFFDGDVDNLPPGWHLIVMARGSLFNVQNLLTADRDGVLCPEHFKEIDDLLISLT